MIASKDTFQKAIETGHPMTPERMLAIIADECGCNLSEDSCVVEFSFRDIPLVLIFDEQADRMRIVSAICNVSELTDDQLMRAMEANFHSALDARYAISSGTVWAVFVHPLSDLTPKLIRSGIGQVAECNATFGDQYASGELRFGG